MFDNACLFPPVYGNYTRKPANDNSSKKKGQIVRFKTKIGYTK